MTKTFSDLVRVGFVPGLVAAMFGSAAAQTVYPHVTADVGYSYFRIDVDEIGATADASGITGRSALWFNEYLALEVEVGAGIRDGGLEVPPFDVNFGLDYFVGVLGKAAYPLTRRVGVYGHVGYARAQLTGEMGFAGSDRPATVVDISQDGYIYGGGATYDTNGPIYGRVDLTFNETVVEDTPLVIDLSALTLAIGRRF